MGYYFELTESDAHEALSRANIVPTKNCINSIMHEHERIERKAVNAESMAQACEKAQIEINNILHEKNLL